MQILATAKLCRADYLYSQAQSHVIRLTPISGTCLVHICYIDDSGEDNVRAFCLPTEPVAEWKRCFDAIKSYRKSLRESDGIFVKKELHATKFLSGRGRIGSRQVTRTRRCEIYREALAATTRLPGVHLFNAFGNRKNELRIFERLMNRLNRALVEWGSTAVCVSDEGKDYNKLVRKMAVFNPVPSMYGRWREGLTRNIVIDRLVENLFYAGLKIPTSSRWGISLHTRC